MTEKEREGNYSSTLGEASHKLCWTLKGPLVWELIYQAPNFSGLEFSSLDT